MSDFTNDIDGYDLDDCDWIEDNFDIESWTKNTYDKAVFIKEMDESYLINCINKLKKI
ncbi:MAG: hypothetical protein IPP74_14470, partial [Alphaproteobacteria bacterium]|nr:hypothetical protein [Alphaproteobacteria bacterium]